MKVTVQSKEERGGEAWRGQEGAEEIKKERGRGGGRRGGRESFRGSPAFPLQIKSSTENSLKKSVSSCLTLTITKHS